MEKNGRKVSRAKTEHLQTTGDTDPVTMKRYMEIEMINLPIEECQQKLFPTHSRTYNDSNFIGALDKCG